MFQEEYINLIHRSLQGGISPVEQEQLNNWLAASDDHQQIADDIEYAWNLSYNFEDDYTPDVEKGLAKFKARIEEESISIEQPEAKVVTIPRRRWLSRIAAAAAILIATSIFWINYNSSPNTVQTAMNATTEVRLDDGTIVYLNENSSLTYPKKFDGKERIVELKGEAFFDVEKNPNQPFIINTTDTKVEVLGTSFNVRAYEQEVATSINVKTGKVRFTVLETDDVAILEQNDAAIFNEKSKTLNTLEDRSQNSFAWHTKTLNFEQSKVADLINRLEQLYNIQITIANPVIANCHYSYLGLKVDEDIKNVLKVIETSSSKFKFSKKGKNGYILNGDSCPN